MRIVDAEVLAVRPVRGGEGAEAYAYLRAVLLDRESATVLDCRVDDGFGQISQGEVVSVVVSVTPYLDRQNNAQLALRVLHRVNDKPAEKPAVRSA